MRRAFLHIGIPNLNWHGAYFNLKGEKRPSLFD